MSEPPRVIQTRYRGVLYRSRTEARWSVFLHAMGLPFAYEPEGYEISSGAYLPDFFVPQWDMFIEVKPPTISDRDRARCAELSMAAKAKLLVALGPPSSATGLFCQAGEWIDGNAQIIECPGCQTVGVTWGDDPDNAPSWGHFITLFDGKHGERCSSPIYPGGRRMSDAVAASMAERFGIFPQK